MAISRRTSRYACRSIATPYATHAKPPAAIDDATHASTIEESTDDVGGPGRSGTSSCAARDGRSGADDSGDEGRRQGSAGCAQAPGRSDHEPREGAPPAADRRRDSRGRRQRGEEADRVDRGVRRCWTSGARRTRTRRTRGTPRLRAGTARRRGGRRARRRGDRNDGRDLDQGDGQGHGPGHGQGQGEGRRRRGATQSARATRRLGPEAPRSAESGRVAVGVVPARFSVPPVAGTGTVSASVAVTAPVGAPAA